MPRTPDRHLRLHRRAGDTIHSDPNGVYEVLLPSDARSMRRRPAACCASVYYLLGNDPGQPGALNPIYNPQYRTIGASFEIYPGVMVPSDLAPTQIGAPIWAPGSQFSQLAPCSSSTPTPQLFARLEPYRERQPVASFHDPGPGLRRDPGAAASCDARQHRDWRLRLERSPDRGPVPAGPPRGPHQLRSRQQRPDHCQRPDLPCPRRRATARRLRGRHRQDLRSGTTRPSAGRSSMPSTTPRQPGANLVVVYPGATVPLEPAGRLLSRTWSSTHRSSCRASAPAAS